jgi:molecular chaperone DnaJ
VDALLGTVIEVPTIEEPVKLKIKPGVQPNTMMRLRGHGVPTVRGSGRGDQYVNLVVKLPDNLTRKQRELLEALRREGI